MSDERSRSEETRIASRAPSAKPAAQAGPGGLRSGRVAETTSRIRALLEEQGFPSEGHRKAALRRVLHEAGAGLDVDELTEFLAAVRSRFPDRTFHAASRAARLEERSAALERETASLRAERDSLRARAQAFDRHLARLLPEDSAGKKPRTKPVSTSGLDPDAIGRLAEALALLLTHAADQEAATDAIEETLGRSKKSGADEAAAIGEILARIAAGGPTHSRDLAELERRLRRFRLLPAALLRGAEQSWKGGARGLLEHLDPKACEESVPKKVIGRDAAVLRECRSRFESFWSQLDKNIAHYFRGVFEKVYLDKMEERS